MPDSEPPLQNQGDNKLRELPVSAVFTSPESVDSLSVEKILEQPQVEPTRSIRHSMLLDLALGVGLLLAMGGFTIGLFKMYLTHSAEQSIIQHNYKAAISVLKNAPLPGFCNFSGSDPEELLNQALYLDAMDKLEVDNDASGALEELQQIIPGSRYFTLAQMIIEEHLHPPSVTSPNAVSQAGKVPVAIKDKTPELSPDLQK